MKNLKEEVIKMVINSINLQKRVVNASRIDPGKLNDKDHKRFFQILNPFVLQIQLFKEQVEEFISND